MKYLTNIFIVLIIIFLVSACGDSPVTPSGKENPPDGKTQVLGLMEMTISGIGTQDMSASIKPADSNIAYNLTRPAPMEAYRLSLYHTAALPTATGSPMACVISMQRSKCVMRTRMEIPTQQPCKT